jgi:antitoxin CptB
MAETREIRIKRLRMRAWHRGIKEMDLILGGWADSHLAGRR